MEFLILHMGFLILIVGSIASVIGILKDNRARKGQRSFLFGLNLVGSLLLGLALIALGLGGWKIYIDGEKAKERQAKLQQQLTQATTERDVAYRKLSEISSQVKRQKNVTGALSTHGSRVIEINSGGLDKLPKGKQGHVWNVGPWHSFPIVDLENESQNLKLRIGDTLTVSFQYLFESQHRVLKEKTYGDYFQRHVRYWGSPLGIIKIGNRLHLIYDYVQDIEVNSVHTESNNNASEDIEIEALLPSIPPHDGLQDIKLTVKVTR